MATQFLILGLLVEGPQHGYALRELFAARYGMSNVVAGGRFYALLTQMEGRGLVEVHQEQIGRRPKRNVYSATLRGKEALRRWLGQPSVRTSGEAPALMLRLLLAARLGEPTLQDLVSVEVRALERARRQLEVERNESMRKTRPRAVSLDSRMGWLRVEGALLALEADARLLELCRKELEAGWMSPTGRRQAGAGQSEEYRR
jgi:DNA-binding PadR family transcriptional regulator